MDKLISILIASYNHEKYIGYMLESALNQTYSNIELIIIDDCSKDKTNEIIESYKEKCEEKFTRFTYIKKEENKGIIDSVNKLIDQAQGEYCFLMASDDAIKPNAIKILADFAKNNPEYAFIGGNSELIDENNQKCYWKEDMSLTHSQEEAKYLTWSDYSRRSAKLCSQIDYDSDDFGRYDSLLKCNYIVNGFMYKKSAILEAGKYKHNVFEDWFMALEVAKKHKFKYIDEVIYEYRKHFSSSIDNVTYSQPRYYTTLMSQKKYCYENNLSELWDEVYGLNCGKFETEFIDKYMSNFDTKESKDILLFASVIQEKNDEIKRLNQIIQNYENKLNKKKDFIDFLISLIPSKKLRTKLREKCKRN